MKVEGEMREERVFWTKKRNSKDTKACENIE